MTKENSTKKKIMEEINRGEVKPKPREYFLARNTGFIVMLVVLTLFSIIFVGSFLADLYVLFDMYNSIGIINPGLLMHTFYEFLLAGLFLALLDYHIYRKTDWPLVRSPKKILGLIIVLILFGGGIFSIIGKTAAENNIREVQKLNIRKGRGDKIRHKLENKGVYFGEVVGISEQKISIKSRAGLREFVNNNDQINQGDLVSIKTKRDGSYEIRVIKKLPKPLTIHYSERILF